MPQQSIQYALGRIGVQGRYALKAAQLERLYVAKGYDEARRALMEIGFTDNETADFQAVADEHVQHACQLIRAVTPLPEVTDCFQLRYDVHNLKVLLKSRFLAKRPEYLSACGAFDVEKLRHAVAEHSYHALPDIFREALDQLEKQLAVKLDPLLIDVQLDQAMYRYAFARLAPYKGSPAYRYFASKADLQNMVMLLRARAMGKNAAFFADIALEGGNVPVRALRNAFEEPDRLPKLMGAYGPRVQLAVARAALDSKALPALEKEMDDYLLGLFAPCKYQSDGVEPLIRYLLLRQREATDVRLILAGKLNGFSQEAVAERVRGLNA